MHIVRFNGYNQDEIRKMTQKTQTQFDNESNRQRIALEINGKFVEVLEGDYVCVASSGLVSINTQIPEVTFTTVAVQFENSPTKYTYKTTDRTIVKGDYAVITSRGRLAVVRVVEVHDEPKLEGPYDFTWLVQKIDMTAYNALTQEEHNANAL